MDTLGVMLMRRLVIKMMNVLEEETVVCIEAQVSCFVKVSTLKRWMERII